MRLQYYSVPIKVLNWVALDKGTLSDLEKVTLATIGVEVDSILVN